MGKGIKGSTYRFRDCTHPGAEGKKPKKGQESFELTIPMEYGENLRLCLGYGGATILVATICALIGNDPKFWDEVDRLADEFVKGMD